MQAVTVPIKKITKTDLKHGAMLYPEKFGRPRTRIDCADIPRPCPFVGCKYNLYLDVNEETGSIKLNFPDLKPSEMEDSCALDVAARGGITLSNVGRVMNITRERVRQLETVIISSLATDKQLEKTNREDMN